MAFHFLSLFLNKHSYNAQMLKKKKIKNTQFKNFVIYGFGQVVNLISPLLVMPYIVSICGEDGLGKVGVGFSFALIAIVLVDYGSYINGTKEVSISNTNNKILEDKFTTIYLAKFILLLIVLVLSIFIILFIPFFQKDKLQLLFSLFIIIGQFINPIWFFQGIQNFKWITTVNILSKVIYVSTIFLFIKNAQDFIYVNFFQGLGLIISSSFGFIWIYFKYNFSFKNVSIKNALKLIKSEFTLTASQLFFSFYQYAPIIIISYVCGNTIAGQFRIIDQVMMIFRTYFQMFFNFIYADVCFKIFNNVTIGIHNWKKNNSLNYMLVLFIVVCFYFNSNAILAFFKVKANNLEELSSYFKIGLVIPVFMGISFALKQLMFSFNKNNEYIKITIYSTLLSLLILYSLLINIGLKGAFFSTISIEIITIISYCLVLKSSFVKKTIK